jgi:hypothetical protein
MHTPGLAPSSDLAAHWLSKAQREQTWAVRLQIGRLPEQNRSAVHSKQLPVGRSHAGAAPFLAMHWPSAVHATHLFAVQMGFVGSLQSAVTRHSTQLPAGAHKAPAAFPVQLALTKPASVAGPGTPPSGVPQETHLLARQMGAVEALSQPSAGVHCSQRPMFGSHTSLPPSARPTQ